jgi:hypothetical protein
MKWRHARPLDAYFIQPVGMFRGIVWQFLAGTMAADMPQAHVLDTPRGPAVLIWTYLDDGGRTKVGAVVGQAAWRAPVRVVREVRQWLDVFAPGAYADPEDPHPSFVRTLEVVGFRRVGDTWQWRS